MAACTAGAVDVGASMTTIGTRSARPGRRWMWSYVFSTGKALREMSSMPVSLVCMPMRRDGQHREHDDAGDEGDDAGGA